MACDKDSNIMAFQAKKAEYLKARRNEGVLGWR